MGPVPPSAVVVATGSDARMRSAVPKPLHRLCGRSMMGHVLASVIGGLQPRRLTVVVGPEDDDLAKELGDGAHGDQAVDICRVPANVRHDPCAAALAALDEWALADLGLDLDPDDDDVLLIPASVPLLDGESLRSFHRAHRSSDAAATMLSGPGDDGTGSASSVWLVRHSLLAPALRRTQTAEISALGDVLRETGHVVATHLAPDGHGHHEIFDRAELATAEAEMRERINARWMRRGVTMVDPARTYVDVTVRLDPDVTLFPGVVLRGATTVGAGTEIGVGCHLVDVRVGAQCRLEQVSAELATIRDHCRVGPHAALAPGSVVPAATITGPFYSAGLDAR